MGRPRDVLPEGVDPFEYDLLHPFTGIEAKHMCADAGCPNVSRRNDGCKLRLSYAWPCRFFEIAEARKSRGLT